MPTAGDCGYGRGPMRPCAYGLAVGDALGAPYGFRARDTFECTGTAGGGHCERTLEAALRCFLNTGSHADRVPAAVDSGGDTDTAAAAAGALAGVHHGFGAIPPEWTGRLRGKAAIERCIWKGDGR